MSLVFAAGVVLVTAVLVLTGCGSRSSGSGEPTVESGDATPTSVCVATAIASCSPVSTDPGGVEVTEVPDAGDEPSALGPDGCGLEVVECGSGALNSRGGAPAECTVDSFRAAVEAEIDGGSFRISDEGCDGSWAVFIVDRSRDACPASDDPQTGCAQGTRAHRTFWQNQDGYWRILTYGGAGDCAEVWAVVPEFPEALCTR